MTTAESNLVSAKAAYEKARVEMDRATGLLLDHAGIVMADAERGQVTHMPKVPVHRATTGCAARQAAIAAARLLTAAQVAPALFVWQSDGRAERFLLSASKIR